MSRSEIVAWQLGVEIEREVRENIPDRPLGPRMDWAVLTTDQQAARFALGDDRFAYWVFKGAGDALAEHPG